MKHAKLIGVLVVLVLVACAATPSGGSPPPPNGPSERVLGTVEFYGDPVRVEVPRTAELEQPFVVTVTTYGGGCIEKGETEVKVEALRAEVRPYDYDTTPVNGDCDDELRLHEHTTTLRFEEVGTAEIVFYGRKENLSGVTQTSVTRTLEVR